ncbi:hypothetical protein ACJ41O_012148 [Fusarium nematophilum]
MVARQRKAHRKSREGCTQCKCNEAHPQCLQCKRAGVPCSFSSPSLLARPINEDSVADLELLENWHRNPVTADFSDDARQFQYDFVRLGFSHHYLLNSILALSALQLFSGDPSQPKWYARAVAHQQAAMTRARPHLQSLDETQRRALLGFSAFTSLYTVSEPLLRPLRVRSLQDTGFDPVKELLYSFQFGRSTTAFVRQNLSSLVHSDAWVLAKFSCAERGDLHGLEARFPQLRELRACIGRHCQGVQQSACLHAVETLFHGIRELLDRPGNSGQVKIISGWGVGVHGGFLDMCTERHPVALVILAHFAVLMSLAKGLWHLRDWPSVLLEHIRGRLGKEWEDIFEWPRGMIFAPAILPSETKAIIL